MNWKTQFKGSTKRYFKTNSLNITNTVRGVTTAEGNVHLNNDMDGFFVGQDLQFSLPVQKLMGDKSRIAGDWPAGFVLLTLSQTASDASLRSSIEVNVTIGSYMGSYILDVAGSYGTVAIPTMIYSIGTGKGLVSSCSMEIFVSKASDFDVTAEFIEFDQFAQRRLELYGGLS